MIDLKLNFETNELSIKNFDLEIVSGIDFVIQNLYIKLKTFRNEWFLDTTLGIDITLNKDLLSFDGHIKSLILNTNDVIELTYYESTFDNDERMFYVKFKCKTSYGETSLIEANI